MNTDSKFLSFGDIILIDNQDYVYIATSLDFVYLAKILDLDTSKYFMRTSERANAPVTTHLVYQFIVLTTTDFSSRIAHLAKTQHEANLLMKFSGFIDCLNSQDKKELKKMLELPQCNISIELKDILAKLKIED